jgi:hypothetical protein
MTPSEAQQKFVAWQQMAQQLEAIKDQELQLRLEVIDAYFPDRNDEGTHTLKLEEGWKLQCVTRISRRLENAKGETDAVVKQLPPEMADKAVVWKPDLKMRGYRDLPPEYRVLVDSVVTSKPGTPSLKLVPPKETS